MFCQLCTGKSDAWQSWAKSFEIHLYKHFRKFQVSLGSEPFSILSCNLFRHSYGRIDVGCQNSLKQTLSSHVNGQLASMDHSVSWFECFFWGSTAAVWDRKPLLKRLTCRSHQSWHPSHASRGLSLRNDQKGEAHGWDVANSHWILLILKKTHTFK